MGGTRRFVSVVFFACAAAPPPARAGASDLAVAPASFDFGIVSVGTPSDPATFALENRGATAITVDVATSDRDRFGIDRTPFEQALAPGGKTTFRVTFVPAAPGAAAAHAYLYVDGAPTPAADVPLTGEGVAPAGRRPNGVVVGCVVDDARPPRWPWLLALALPALLVAHRRIRRR